jgi:hypothetical protein
MRMARPRCDCPPPLARDTRGPTARPFPVFRETLAGDRVEAVAGLRELAAELRDQETANRVGASSASSEPEKL